MHGVETECVEHGAHVVGDDELLARLDDLDGARTELVAGSGSTMRSLAFDLAGMPYGTAQKDVDAAKAGAVRAAVADLVDRRALARVVGHGATAPLEGFVPDGLPGADPVLRGTTGDRHGEPDVAAARAALDQAGVPVPLALTLTIVPSVDPAGTAAEFHALAEQLEAGDLFRVDVKRATAAEFRAHRASNDVEAYAGWWSPDGTDPATYRSPYQLGDAQLGSHYATPDALQALAAPVTAADPAARAADIRAAQLRLARDLPVVPLLQDRQLAIRGHTVTGVRFDGSLTLRFGSLRMP